MIYYEIDRYIIYIIYIIYILYNTYIYIYYVYMIYYDIYIYMIYYINRVQAASRQEKTDLARFGLPFLQRWVMWAASALMCSAMVYHPKVQR